MECCSLDLKTVYSPSFIFHFEIGIQIRQTTTQKDNSLTQKNSLNWSIALSDKASNNKSFPQSPSLCTSRCFWKLFQKRKLLSEVFYTYQVLFKCCTGWSRFNVVWHTYILAKFVLVYYFCNTLVLQSIEYT